MLLNLRGKKGESDINLWKSIMSYILNNGLKKDFQRFSKIFKQSKQSFSRIATNSY